MRNIKTEWILCPVCGSKTRDRIRKDTIIKKYPLYCPKCKKETLIDAENLQADKRYEPTHQRRMKRNKANYSLDAEDGIENAACEFEPSPEASLELMDQYRRLCCALNHLPEAQGRRIEAVYLLGMTTHEVAVADGVSERAVQIALERGLANMKKFF